MRKALYFLGILDDSDTNWLTTMGEVRLISAGTIIIQQSVPVDSVFLVIDGQFQVYSKSVEIAKLSAGEIVGEISFVDSRPPSASVKATVDSRVLAVPKSALSVKLKKDLGFASRFYLSVATLLAYRLRVADAQLSAGQSEAGNEFHEDLDELPANTLENVALASARFDLMIKRLAVHSGGKRP
jgi:CRP/FNR family cyclic AMP-dependent transcriptional regulator